MVNSLKNDGKLPYNYIDKKSAETLGWKSKKALNNYAPGKAFGGDIYNDTGNKLPTIPGRRWYEADVAVDYRLARSNAKNTAYRIAYSNDELIYDSYDHYETFFKIYP